MRLIPSVELFRFRMHLIASVGLFLLVSANATFAYAQGGTDIWVAGFSEMGSRVTVERPRNVTNRAGYDNQPFFKSSGDAILYTSIRDGQADIWQAWLDGGAPERLTNTQESEYSPTPMPDGEHFSVIRVEEDSTQRLWKFRLDGSGSPSLVLNELRPVGYHVWVGDYSIGAFVLGSPNALVLADSRTERVDTLARNIGRALVRIPGRQAFSFVQHDGDSSWVSEVDVRTGAVKRITVLPEGAEYHVWTVGGRLITSSGTRLLIKVDGRWDVLTDFAAFGVRNVSRLALSPRGDHIAFVAADR